MGLEGDCSFLEGHASSKNSEQHLGSVNEEEGQVADSRLVSRQLRVSDTHKTKTTIK